MMKDAKTIRSQIRRQRQAIPAAERERANGLIAASFRKLDSLQSASNVAGYLAFDGEADPIALMEWAVEQGKQVFVPVVIDRQQPLRFTRWTPGEPTKKNCFEIDEPDPSPDRWLPTHELDFVITPLVAFDAVGHRLGVGGGFYDRSFAFCRDVLPDQAKSTTLAGFAFALQQVEKIEPQAWDVKLDLVVTERYTYDQ